MSLPRQVQSRLYHFKSHILSLVAAHVFSVAMVSRLFGISRNTFYKQRSAKKLMQNSADGGYDRRQRHPRVGGDDHVIPLA